ncbi:MAG: Gfo/Idh/MocA family protein [Candidatus Rokuibacteriota bacterium]
MSADPARGSTVGVIGLGYGRAHIPAFQAQGCRVVAVCQRDRAAAKAVADRYGVPQVYEGWEEMLERARPEIVVIATPPHLHLPIALRALDGGAHVLCEKPLALTTAEARRMAQAAGRARRVAMTAFNWRFAAAMQELDARVRAGALGRVFHLDARWLGGRWADETAAATWRMDRAQAGHGAMGDQGVHLVDMIRATFGEFVRVTAHAGLAYPARAAPGVGRPPDADDYCTVIGELASGAQATFTVSRAAHAMTEHTLEAYGARGALHYRLARDGRRWWEGELRLTEGGAGFQRVEPRAAPSPSVGEGDAFEIIGKATIAPLVARLLDGVRSGVTPAPSFADGVRAQAVLDAVLEALGRRAWVEVEAG